MGLKEYSIDLNKKTVRKYGVEEYMTFEHDDVNSLSNCILLLNHMQEINASSYIKMEKGNWMNKEFTAFIKMK